MCGTCGAGKAKVCTACCGSLFENFRHVPFSLLQAAFDARGPVSSPIFEGMAAPIAGGAGSAVVSSPPAEVFTLVRPFSNE